MKVLPSSLNHVARELLFLAQKKKIRCRLYSKLDEAHHFKFVWKLLQSTSVSLRCVGYCFRDHLDPFVARSLYKFREDAWMNVRVGLERTAMSHSHEVSLWKWVCLRAPLQWKPPDGTRTVSLATVGPCGTNHIFDESIEVSMQSTSNNIWADVKHACVDTDDYTRSHLDLKTPNSYNHQGGPANGGLTVVATDKSRAW
jgi:hypothetical protein